MPASLAIPAWGTLLQVNATRTGGGAWTSVAELRDIQPPNSKLATKEVTTQVSPGAWDEFVGTILSGGTVTIAANMIPTNTTQNSTSPGLRFIMANRLPWNMRVVYSDTGASTDTFNAFVEDFKPDAKVADPLAVTIQLKITGQPTFI